MSCNPDKHMGFLFRLFKKETFLMVTNDLMANLHPEKLEEGYRPSYIIIYNKINLEKILYAQKTRSSMLKKAHTEIFVRDFFLDHRFLAFIHARAW